MIRSNLARALVYDSGRKIKASEEKRKKKSMKKLLESLDGVLEGVSGGDYIGEEELTKLLIERVKRVYVRKREVMIPLGIFSKKLGALEALTKYLKENLDMKYSEIGRLLVRDERTIWSSYDKAKKKMGVGFVVGKIGLEIPISEFSDNRLTILERIVVYLKDGMQKKYSEISEIIDRDQRNVWGTYSKAKKKLNGRDKQW